MWIKFRSLRSQFLLIILGITVSLVLIMGFLDLQTVTTTSTRIATMSLKLAGPADFGPHPEHPDGGQGHDRCPGPFPGSGY